MRKNMLKISLVVFMIFFIIMSLMPVEATAIIDGLDKEKNKNTVISNTIKNTSNNVFGALEVVGTGIAVIMLTYIGITYVTRSPEGKSEFKKTAYLFAIGAVMVFAAPRIVRIVIELSQSIAGNLK